MKFFVPALLALAARVACVPTTTTSSSTPGSVGGIAIGTILNLLGLGLVTEINVFVTLDSLTTNLVSTNFEVKNPLPFEITIDSISTQAGLNGTVQAQFTQSFSKFVVPPLGSANSGTFPNVDLVQGATAALAIIPFGELDIITADVKIRALTIDGFLGVPLEIDNLKQTAVPTTYTLDLGGL